MHDMNDLVPPQAGILLTHAMDINDAGVITGRATNSTANAPWAGTTDGSPALSPGGQISIFNFPQGREKIEI